MSAPTVATCDTIFSPPLPSYTPLYLLGHLACDMAQSRPLSPLECLDVATPDEWSELDTVYPAHSQRLNGHHVTSGGNEIPSPSPVGYGTPGASRDSQSFHLDGTSSGRYVLSSHDNAEAMPALTPIGWSPPFTTPLNLSASVASESNISAQGSPPDSIFPLHGGLSNAPLVSAPSQQYMRYRQLSWDLPDGDILPPYTPSLIGDILSPSTPGFSSSTSSSSDPSMSPPLLTPSSSFDHNRHRSVSSSGFSDATLLHSSLLGNPIRKRSMSSTGDTKKPRGARAIQQTRSNGTRQLPVPPTRLFLVNPVLAEEPHEVSEEPIPRFAPPVHTHFLQPESPAALLGRIQKTIAVLGEYVRAVGPFGHLNYGKVNERVTNIQNAVRALLYVTATPLEDAREELPPDYLGQTVVLRRVPDPIRAISWKVVGSLSDLVTTTIELEHDPALSFAGRRFESTLMELENSVRDLVTEVQKVQQEDRRLNPTGRGTFVKALRGSFSSLDSSHAVSSAGWAASWKGLGYGRPSSTTEIGSETSRLRHLDATVVYELNIMVSSIERELLSLIASSSSAHGRGSDRLQSEGQYIASRLSSLLDFLGGLDISRHASGLGDANSDAVERSHLIRTVEAAMQALFDDSALFLTAIQQTFGSLEPPESSSSRNDPIGSMVTTIMANLSLAMSSLRALSSINRDPAVNLEAGPSEHRVSVEHPTPPGGSTRLPDIQEASNNSDDISHQATPGGTLLPPAGEDGYRDLGNASGTVTANYRYPSIAVRNSSFESIDQVHASTRPSHFSVASTSSVAISIASGTSSAASVAFPPAMGTSLMVPLDGRLSPASTMSLSTDGSDTSASRIERPSSVFTVGSSSKVFKVLGNDVPTHYINNMEMGKKPWYLRPTYSSSEIRMEPSGEVSAGTIAALVERLTAHDYGDALFHDDFLMTFRSFMTANELVEKLIDRFWIRPPDKMSDAQLGHWKEMKQHVVRSRVLNTLKTLIVDEDILEKDETPTILEIIKKFISDPEVKESQGAKQLSPLIERLQRGIRVKVKTLNTAALAPPPPIVPRSRDLKILDIDPLEMARQLTLLEASLYKTIRPLECLQRTREPTADKSKDTIGAIIRLNTQLVNWVVESVLSRSDARKRGQTIKHFINVADRCRSLQNFSSMVAIVSALTKPEIRRLARSWEHVSQRAMAMFQPCDALLDSFKNTNKFMKCLQEITPPCVPFFGPYLSTLTFINDGARDKLGDNEDLINFRKRQKAATVIRDIKRWQSKPYNLQAVANVLAFLERSLKRYGDGIDYSTQWWHLSLEREPPRKSEEGERGSSRVTLIGGS